SALPCQPSSCCARATLHGSSAAATAAVAAGFSTTKRVTTGAGGVQWKPAARSQRSAGFEHGVRAGPDQVVGGPLNERVAQISEGMRPAGLIPSFQPDRVALSGSDRPVKV